MNGNYVQSIRRMRWSLAAVVNENGGTAQTGGVHKLGRLRNRKREFLED